MNIKPKGFRVVGNTATLPPAMWGYVAETPLAEEMLVQFYGQCDAGAQGSSSVSAR